MKLSAYDSGLDRNAANFVALSPLSFLPKAVAAFPRRPAIVYGEERWDWATMYGRCRRLASALAQCGVGRGDTVAIIAPNTPPMCEAHFGVPMTGAVLLTLNTRLDAAALAFQLAHSETRVLLCDREYGAAIRRALADLPPATRPVVVRIEDPAAAAGAAVGTIEYEAFLAGGDPTFAWSLPPDEWDAISLNYTSGTTGNPKGVVAHHRGAYLNAINNRFTANVQPHAAYLWMVPMFHCNGWCFPWTVAAVAGTNVCLRRIEPGAVFDAIRRHHVTQTSAAPIVYGMLIGADPTLRAGIVHRITGTTGGAAPPSATFAGAAAIGIDLVHIYGLTETYGPAAVCPEQEHWAALAVEERAQLASRQGFATVLQEAMTVRDPDTLAEVPHDGQTIGEIMFRGNLVMKGYFKNPAATQEAFDGGWFHTGDLAVVEPDGYVRIRDRSKDVIISGGENISSIEVEDVLHRHPAIAAAAVVGRPDAKWGETPVAFLEFRDGMTATTDEIRAFCRLHLAGYKMPKYVVVASIPRTSTGKVQKYLLRETARTLATLDERQGRCP